MEGVLGAVRENEVDVHVDEGRGGGARESTAEDDNGESVEGSESVEESESVEGSENVSLIRVGSDATYQRCLTGLLPS